MSTLVFSVDILAGRTDLADVPSIGFVGGDYLWSTADCQGHKTGIIDQERISSFGAQCNVTYGGEVSEPTSELTISALSTELLEHIAQNGVRLVGKVVRVNMSVNGAAYTTIRKAPIESLEYVSNTEIVINTKMANMLGAEPMTTTVVNESLLMGVDGDKSGLTISKAYGGKLQIPLTQFTNGQAPAISTTGIDAWVDAGLVVHGLRDLEVCDDPVTVAGELYSFKGDGKNKAKTEMVVQSVYNDENNPGAPTRILLNHNGDSGWVTGLAASLLGGCLLGVRGSGAGESFSVVAVSATTLNGVYGEWCTLDRRVSDGGIVASGIEALRHDAILDISEGEPYTSELRFPDNIIKHLYISPLDMPLGNNRLRGSYIAGSNSFKTSSNDNATVLVNGYPTNIYMASIIPNTAVEGVVGYTSGKKVVPISVPTTSVRTVLQDTNYALLQIIPKQGIASEDAKSITVGVNEWYRCYLDNTPMFVLEGYEQSTTMAVNPAGNRMSTMPNNLQLSDNWIEVIQNEYIDDPGNPGIEYCGQVISSIYTRIDSEGSISSLSPSDDAVSSLYPLISVKCESVGTWDLARGFALRIRCHVINECGVSLGYKEVTHGVELNDDIVQGEVFGPFQLDYTDGSHTPGTEALQAKIASGLDMRELCVGATGNSAKYLYTQVQTVLVNPYKTITAARSTYKVSIKTQGVGMGIRLGKDTLKATVTPNLGYHVHNPVDLLYQALSDVPSVTLDSVAFASASAAMDSKLLPHGGSYPAYYTESGNTTESVVSDIAKASGIAVVTNRDSSISPRWFIDDYRDGKLPSFDFNHDSIVSDSLKITRPSTGFMCTDFHFELAGSVTTRKLCVNSGALSFPGQQTWSVATNVPEYQCQITNVKEHGNNQVTLFITPVYPVSVTRPPFIPGMLYLVRTQTTENYATICRMDGFYYLNGWRLLLTKVAMLDGGPLVNLEPMGWVSNIATMRQQPDWKYLVTSNLEADYYLLARNLWEIATRARDFTQTVIPLPSDYAVIKQPIWPTAEGFANHMLYAVAHTGYAKTLITFDVPIDASTADAYLVDYGRFSAGPYATKPTFGWIVSWDINPAKGTYTLKVLTAVSDEDTLYLDENHTLGLNAQMVIDETVTGSIIDEGVI